MASFAAEDGKDLASSPAVSFLKVNFFLRLFVHAASVPALMLMFSSKQKVADDTDPKGSSVFVFNHLPALVFLLASLIIVTTYTGVSLAFSGCAIKKPSLASSKLLLHLAVLDLLMAGLMASATGAGAGVAFVGFEGNSHAKWDKICNVYDKFCRNIGISLALSLAGSVGLVLLVVLSLYTLHRRSR